MRIQYNFSDTCCIDVNVHGIMGHSIIFHFVVYMSGRIKDDQTFYIILEEVMEIHARTWNKKIFS